MAAWLADADDIRLPDLWPGYVDLTDEGLRMHLVAARQQVAEFGPDLADPDDPPEAWVIAQAMQARANVLAGKASTAGDQVGGYGDTVTVFPMDWQVKNMIRPKRGKPVVL